MFTMFTVKKLSQNEVTTKNKQANKQPVAGHYMAYAKLYLHSTLEHLLAYIRFLLPVNLFDVTSQPVKRWT